jgi:D-serine deaminase-like pyridoxal phosphate-dependent protein
MDTWFTIRQSEELLTPALLFYKDRIQENIRQMIGQAQSPSRLRPHIKTYKCKPIVELQLKAGIDKFKCTTIREAILLAELGVKDILIAYPLVGPAQKKFLQLISQYPNSTFSVLIDHPDQITQWNNLDFPSLNVLIDLDVGMHRTGIAPADVPALLEKLDSRFQLKGWHLYDGHNRETDPEKRKEQVEQEFQAVEELLEQVDPSHTGEIVCGGSITFSMHALDEKRHGSPGTTLLWDQRYAKHFPDLPFQIAATVATRVVSKPGTDLLCLDLGHKAIGSEMNGKPVYFPQLPDFELTVHSEEHMVIRTPRAAEWNIGDMLYGFPWHICPTVALHEQAWVVEDQRITDQWDIEARARVYK